MNQERLLQVILSPHISEKASIGAEKRNEYAFEVAQNATKPEIKDAIELLFNTKVRSVRVVSVKSKLKMFRGKEGKRSGWKKAYVMLHEGQKLELAGAQ